MLVAHRRYQDRVHRIRGPRRSLAHGKTASPDPFTFQILDPRLSNHLRYPSALIFIGDRVEYDVFVPLELSPATQLNPQAMQELRQSTRQDERGGVRCCIRPTPSLDLCVVPRKPLSRPFWICARIIFDILAACDSAVGVLNPTTWASNAAQSPQAFQASLDRLGIPAVSPPLRTHHTSNALLLVQLLPPIRTFPSRASQSLCSLLDIALPR
ncbi:hypothetical protein C8R46DRAFT_1226654 [Mycena filopes]|nr:hypothetical protein C8R46DRAFT_1226654 [Mycena filopes]